MTRPVCNRRTESITDISSQIYCENSENNIGY